MLRAGLLMTKSRKARDRGDRAEAEKWDNGGGGKV
jgi:hypothetical protein